MNETIPSPRQLHILNLVSQSEQITQVKLLNHLQPVYNISRATLLRDLAILIKAKLIKSSGNAKNITYSSFSPHPLLKIYDPARYFSDPPDKRTGAKISFNFDIFAQLHHLITPKESVQLNQVTRKLSGIETVLPPIIFKRELERFCIELSWKSSEIEGNTYTLFETEALIQENRSALGKSKYETQMILNHKTVFDTIISHRHDFAQLNLSDIAQLHNQLILGLEVPPGIRTHAVGITGSTYVPLDNQHQLKEIMGKTIILINQVSDPIEKAIIAGALIPYIQPFADGNKRTGRMLSNAILLAHDLLPVSYRSVDKDIFKQALILFYEQNSLSEFKKIILEQIIFANHTYFRTNRQ